MGKIKNLCLIATNVSVLYFVIPISILVILPTLWYTRPLLHLTDVDVKIYQLAITVLGVTVGIGTVVNSARSAKMSTESIKLTKEKDLEEKSSHLIVLSLNGEFSYNSPMYSQEVVYDFPSYYPLIEFLSSESQINKNQKASSKEVINHIKILRQHMYQDAKDNHCIVIHNSGKGIAVNLEYNFLFKNAEEFIGYNFLNNKDFYINNSFENMVFNYQLGIYQHSESEQFIVMADKQIQREMKKNPIFSEKDISEESIHLIKINKHYQKYNNILLSKEKICFPIPNSFMILCKHYILYKNLFEKQDDNSQINNVYNPPPIPQGEISITFSDESKIRSGKYSSSHRSKLTYKVFLKELPFPISNGNIEFYLEIELEKYEE